MLSGRRCFLLNTFLSFICCSLTGPVPRERRREAILDSGSFHSSEVNWTLIKSSVIVVRLYRTWAPKPLLKGYFSCAAEQISSLSSRGFSFVGSSSSLFVLSDHTFSITTLPPNSITDFLLYSCSSFTELSVVT